MICAPLPAQTLTGKVAVVTGSSRGLGAAIVLDLAKRGANVCQTAIPFSRSDQLPTISRW